MRVTVRPVVHEQTSRRIRDIFCHFVHDLAINIENHTIGCPVKTVLVELLVRSEREILNIIAPGIGCVEAVPDGFWRLQHQIDASLGFVELSREEFQVDLLRVVVVLLQSVHQILL